MARHRGTGRFDSTYEGLKHEAASAGLPRETRFDSTYEGLKPSSTAIRGMEVERFDSTYEGLKPYRGRDRAR